MTTTIDINVQTVPMTKQEFLQDLIMVGMHIVSERDLTRKEKRLAAKAVELVARKNVTTEFWSNNLEGSLPRQELAFDIFVERLEEQLDEALARYRR